MANGLQHYVHDFLVGQPWSDFRTSRTDARTTVSGDRIWHSYKFNFDSMRTTKKISTKLIFHYSRHFTLKRVTSLRFQFPRYNVKATQLLRRY